MVKATGIVVVAVLVAYGIHAYAQMRADARPAVTPIGSSSSNGVSFAWFYDPTDRTVFVCRIGQAPADAVDCKTKTAL